MTNSYNKKAKKNEDKQNKNSFIIKQTNKIKLFWKEWNAFQNKSFLILWKYRMCVNINYVDNKCKNESKKQKQKNRNENG